MWHIRDKRDIVNAMLVICVAVLDDGYRHVRESNEGLNVSGGMTQPALCGADVVWDVDGEFSHAYLKTQNACPRCRSYAESLLKCVTT